MLELGNNNNMNLYLMLTLGQALWQARHMYGYFILTMHKISTVMQHLNFTTDAQRI